MTDAIIVQLDIAKWVWLSEEALTIFHSVLGFCDIVYSVMCQVSCIVTSLQ